MAQRQAMRQPHPLPKERLAKLSTHRLLQVLKVARAYWLGLWRGGTDIPDDGVSSRYAWESQKTYEERVAAAEADWKFRKETIETYEANIKSILATREHVVRA